MSLKSDIVGINIEEERVLSMATEVGCGVGSWPLSYLGLPLGDNPRRSGFWEPVIERVSRKLEGWLKGCLSRGGRLTLIQSVLESVPIYYLSLFKIPILVAQKIEKLMRDFLWDGFGENKKDHLINWKTVSKSKRKGGLGIGNIVKKNEALLGKWLWRFPLEQNTLWGSIIRSKYGIQANGWDSNLVVRGSYRNPWKAISNNLDSFKTFIRLKVGKGDRIRFWEDIWINEVPLSSLFPRLYSVSCQRNCLISSVVSWSHSNQISWGLSFRRLFNSVEVEDFEDLLALVNNAPISIDTLDKRVWVGDKSGFFSCKSFFVSLIDSLEENIFAPHKMIWKVGVPPKVKMFAWLAAWKKVNTCDLLQSKRPLLSISPSWCILCRQDNETNDHLLIHCHFVQKIWARVFDVFEIVGAVPLSWYEFMSIDWCLQGNRKKVKFMWRCCCLAVIWFVWKERNVRIFENYFADESEVWCKIKSAVSLWAFSSKLFGSLSISDIHSNWDAAMA